MYGGNMNNEPEDTREPDFIFICICGTAIECIDDEEDDGPWWIHQGPATGCEDPAPAAETIAAQRRGELSERLAETGDKLTKAGAEMRDLRRQVDAVAARLEAMDEQPLRPAVVRRATLNQVWDKLMDAGDTKGAMLVMRMIRSIHEGDWS